MMVTPPAAAVWGMFTVVDEADVEVVLLLLAEEDDEDDIIVVWSI